MKPFGSFSPQFSFPQSIKRSQMCLSQNNSQREASICSKVISFNKPHQLFPNIIINNHIQESPESHHTIFLSSSNIKNKQENQNSPIYKFNKIEQIQNQQSNSLLQNKNKNLLNLSNQHIEIRQTSQKDNYYVNNLQIIRPVQSLPQSIHEIRQQRPISQNSLVLLPQQSYAPSQKTIVLGQLNIVQRNIDHSNIQTEKLNKQETKIIQKKNLQQIKTEAVAKSAIFGANIQNLPNPNINDRWWKQNNIQQQFKIKQNLSDIQANSQKLTKIQKQYEILKSLYDQLVFHYQLKELQIQKLLNQQKPVNELLKQLQQKGMLIELLKKQNQEVKRKNMQLNKSSQTQSELQTTIASLKRQIKQKDIFLQRYKQESEKYQPKIQQSKMTELSVQVSKLTAKLQAKQELHERQLRLQKLKFSELKQKLNDLQKEKDKIIQSYDIKLKKLQDKKLSRNQNQLNKVNQSNILSQRQKPKNQTNLSNSAINLPYERMSNSKNQQKKQVQNLRKQLFDIQRQKLIIQKRYEQLQQNINEQQTFLSKRKNQITHLKRQLSLKDDVESQRYQLQQLLNKKNLQIQQLRQIIRNNQKYSNQYEGLSAQNQKLHELNIKKNEQLSDLTCKLSQYQKIITQYQNNSPKIGELQEQIQTLVGMIQQKSGQINRLQNNIDYATSCINERQYQIQKLKVIIEQYQIILKQQRQQYQQLQNLYKNQKQFIVQLQQNIQKQKKQMKNKESQWKMKAINLQQQIIQKTKQQNKLNQKIKELIEHQQNYKLKAIQYQQISNKYRQLQSLNKNYKIKLHKYQQQLQLLKQKDIKHTNCQKLIQDLSSKVNLYQKRILDTPHAKYLFRNNYSPSSKAFQDKIIYQLKRQNSQLKQNLNQSNKSMTNRSSIKNTQSRKIDDNIKRIKSQQFFIKNLKQTQFETKNYYQNYSNPKSLQHDLSLQKLQLLYKQDINFYKNKNRQLQNRVNQLIKITNNLKKTINQSSIKEQPIKKFYQQQLKRANDKISKLQQQNQKFKFKQQKYNNKMHQNLFIPKKVEITNTNFLQFKSKTKLIK